MWSVSALRHRALAQTPEKCRRFCLRIGSPKVAFLLSTGDFNRPSQHLQSERMRSCRTVTQKVWFATEQKAKLWGRWRQVRAFRRSRERWGAGPKGRSADRSAHGGIAPLARRTAAWALKLGEARRDLSRHCGRSCHPPQMHEVLDRPHPQYTAGSRATAAQGVSCDAQLTATPVGHLRLALGGHNPNGYLVSRVVYCPVQCKVGYRFPAFIHQGPVRTLLEDLERSG